MLKWRCFPGASGHPPASRSRPRVVMHHTHVHNFGTAWRVAAEKEQSDARGVHEIVRDLPWRISTCVTFEGGPLI